MSAKAGTFQGTQSGVSWSGAWIAAILLSVIVAVTLLAVTSADGGAVEKAPASTRFEVTDQLTGGRNFLGDTSGTTPARQPIMIGSYACHQCR